MKNVVEKLEQIKKNRNGAGFAASIIMLLIVIMIAAALVTTVAYQSNTAADNADVAEVPGGTSLISLWPLLFIIAPVLFIVKEVFF